MKYISFKIIVGAHISLSRAEIHKQVKTLTILQSRYPSVFRLRCLTITDGSILSIVYETRAVIVIFMTSYFLLSYNDSTISYGVASHCI
jgi:hypothetical protein